MKMYEGFANIYDKSMKNIPYVDWCEDIYRYLKEHGLKKASICELGCGTGTMAELLAKKGHDILGVDISESMLQIALEKKIDTGLDILYVKQDMREFQLHKKMDVILSICDSMNYMMTEQDLMHVFESARENLKENGLFLFDVKTSYCFKHIMGNQVRTEQTEDTCYIWENYFYDEDEVNEYVLTIFNREDESNLYHRVKESHYQKAYKLDDLESLLNKSGFGNIEVYGDRIGKKLNDKSKRMYIIAKK